MRLGASLLAALIAFGTAAQAERVGWYVATENDLFGDTYDRWRTSTVQSGAFFGEPWDGRAPERFGELIELRFRADIYSPANVANPLESDRRFAGALGFGFHSHIARGEWEGRIGADFFVIGPQTGLIDLQERLHVVLDFPIPDEEGFEIGNQTRAHLSAEIARAFDRGAWQIRPFAEAEVGTEDLIRVGVDATWGALREGALLARLPTSGHRILALDGETEGMSFFLGADIARVWDSVYLPVNIGPALEPIRYRVRAGLHREFRRFDLFYGTSWLSPEFEGQFESQFVGALQVRWRF